MQEKVVKPIHGLVMVLAIAASIALCIYWIKTEGREIYYLRGSVPSLLGGIALLLVTLTGVAGFFIVNPNDAKALLLFGVYKGTVFTSGLWWVNPFIVTRKVSLRARNLTGQKLKVNDKAGNPIEIAAVVVWKVKNTFQALFEVDDYVHFVEAQSESAVRQLAGTYPYDAHVEGDDHDESTVSLRAGREIVSEVLEKALQDRLGRAGIEIIEARLAHLAYAPEIAGAMLQRQQANAVVAARARIVDGAVGMVRMALHKLETEKIVALDDERKAAMVSNLLVVLCSHEGTQPVLNTGSLYT